MQMCVCVCNRDDVENVSKQKERDKREKNVHNMRHHLRSQLDLFVSLIGIRR